jgi:Protein of unknown function (DUF1549)/Planctomycete cytochrome C
MARAAILSLAAMCWCATARAADPAALEFFEKSVRPVLVEKCLSCHADKAKGGLRLDTREAVLKGGRTGAAIVPGKPKDGLLPKAIQHTDKDLKMPPTGKLLPREVAALEKWIELGAPWPEKVTLLPLDAIASAAAKHWAFRAVQRPAVPQIRNPKIEIRNEIDNFILAKFGDKGLSLSPRADKRTLIRRATFDLTGLPPSAEEVDAFTAGNEAYSVLVNRLLDSPQYGEQWARHWLDVARYSDTKGYVYAREQRFWLHAWVYRDWVVQSLNNDLPYDRFLLLQIAADQAAPDDKEALAALGWEWPATSSTTGSMW